MMVWLVQTASALGYYILAVGTSSCIMLQGNSRCSSVCGHCHYINFVHTLVGSVSARAWRGDCYQMCYAALNTQSTSRVPRGETAINYARLHISFVEGRHSIGRISL